MVGIEAPLDPSKAALWGCDWPQRIFPEDLPPPALYPIVHVEASRCRYFTAGRGAGGCDLKGIVILILLAATFLGGYHLGREGAFGDLSTDKAVQFASKAFDALKKLTGGFKGGQAATPAQGEESSARLPAPQPAQISAARADHLSDDGITLQINGKTYVVCARPR